MEYTACIPGVFAIPLFDTDSCRSLVNQTRTARSWEPARIITAAADGHYSLADPQTRNAETLPLEYLPSVYRCFDDRIARVMVPLAHRLYHVHLPQHSDAHAVRYLPGGHYRAHRDREPGLENRYLTILCYLNDDFSGGATRFPEFNYSETPCRGKAILFPAEYWHCAEPVIEGCKYILVAWLVGPAPIRWI